MRIRRSSARAGAAFLIGAGAVLASAAPKEPVVPVLVSESYAGGVPGNNGSYFGQATPNGRFVAFTSDATDMRSTPGNSSADIFLRDMKTGQTTLVSENLEGNDGLQASVLPSVSNNGRLVLFMSYATDLIGGDRLGVSDVFLADLRAGDLWRIDVGPDGQEGYGYNYSYPASLSANGRYAVFYSNANNLSSTPNPDFIYNVFVYDRVKDRVSLVSARPDGDQSNGDSFYSTISPNGRFLVFESLATDLADGSADGVSHNIFIHDRKSRKTRQVTSSWLGFSVGADCEDPSVSNNGRYVTFRSRSPDLVQGDTNGVSDSFLKDMKTKATTRLSTGPGGAQGDLESFEVAMSGNAKVILFESRRDA